MNMQKQRQPSTLTNRLLKAMLACAIVALVTLTPRFSDAAPAFKVLIFHNATETVEDHKDSVPAGIAAIKQLGAANDFTVATTTDPQAFTAANLAQYKAIIFLSPEAQNLNSTQQTAFESYIEGGGGFVGVHGAMYMERNTGWTWYRELLGANVPGGAPPKPENEVDVNVVDPNHPSTEDLPNTWQRKDEWYNFVEPLVSNVNVLLTVDEDDYDAGANKMGNPHPIAWYHSVGSGRSWYTGGGHYDDNWDEPLFRAHVLGGILWAADATIQLTPTVPTTTATQPTVTVTPTTTSTTSPALTRRGYLPLALK